MAAWRMVVEKRASAHESALRELAVAGALASAAILAAAGQTAWAGGAVLLGFAALVAQNPGITAERNEPPKIAAGINGGFDAPRFMP